MFGSLWHQHMRCWASVVMAGLAAPNGQPLVLTFSERGQAATLRRSTATSGQSVACKFYLYFSDDPTSNNRVPHWELKQQMGT